MSANGFTNLDLTPHNLDVYHIRTAIFARLKSQLSALSGRLLDVGCGQMPYRRHILENSPVTEYTGLDIVSDLPYRGAVVPDCIWDGTRIPFGDCSFDCSIATEVLEHCPSPEIIISEVYRVLRAGGIFFFTVPFLWPLHEAPYDQYRYTPFALERVLSNAGFTSVNIQAHGGWDASLAQMLGLWVRRRGMPRVLCLLFSVWAYPFVWALARLDRVPESFSEGMMVTGLSGTAVKLER